MVFNLLDVVDSGVVSNAQSGNSTPDGYASLSMDIDIWIIISIILFIIAVFFIIITIILIINKNINKKETPKYEQKNNNISQKDIQIISEYKKLTQQEKQVIEDTIKTFNNSRKE